MKKILITGAGSYIGTSFEKWVSQWPNEYDVNTISVRGDKWKNKDFTSYDVIYHVAAIVHVKESNNDKYFKVNRDLAVEIAQKAKEEGVNQFIFLSTMGVYGKETGYIDEKTKTNPKTPYAQSKLEAEKLLKDQSDDNFIITILRPPMVYGKDCPGNYSKLAKLALKISIFPYVNNKRSMIYIDFLSEFIRIAVDRELEGVFYPQNAEYINISDLVQLIARSHGKDIKLIRGITVFIKLGTILSKTFAKVFGTYVYDKNMPGGPEKIVYTRKNTMQTIIETENKFTNV